MFDFLKAPRFRKRVFAYIESQLITYLGKDRGGNAVGAFATAAQKSDISPYFLEGLRRANLSVEDAAIAYLDAAITATKRVLPANPDTNLAQLLGDMETGLDQMFLAKPGTVVPRNGKTGPHLAEFTDETDS